MGIHESADSKFIDKIDKYNEKNYDFAAHGSSNNECNGGYLYRQGKVDIDLL